MTGLSPEERFENHRQGIKSALVVKRYGLRLLPELYAHLNPMPYDTATGLGFRQNVRQQLEEYWGHLSDLALPPGQRSVRFR